METKQLYENNQPFYPKTPLANVINIGGGIINHIVMV